MFANFGALDWVMVRGRGFLKAERKFVLQKGKREAIIVFVTMEIMSARPLSFAKICGFSCCFFLGNAPGLIAAELVLEKVPALTVEQAPAYPENLARYHFGAQVEAAPKSNPIASLQLSSKSDDTNRAEAALLCDDPTVGYALPSGSSTLLISLSKIENIDNLSFLNNGAKGNLTIATSSAKLPADSPQWHKLPEQELTSDIVKAKIGPSEAKYIRLTFNVTEPGRIAGLGVYSTPGLSALTMSRSRNVNIQEKSGGFTLISNNVTDMHTKARALYVSSGDDLKQANNMIDGQPATSYTFAATDASPTAIVDLGRTMSLRRISAIYSPRQGSIDFFVLQSLPGADSETGAPKTIRFDDSALANLKPVGSIVDVGTGRAAIDFPEKTGRYIMLKWNPATQQDSSFSVAEVAAFSGKQPAKMLARNLPNMTLGQVDAKDIPSEGKDFKDAKEIPEEGPPAEGPPLPLPPPPPFTFVPEVITP
jgi:hypothetical protein